MTLAEYVETQGFFDGLLGRPQWKLLRRKWRYLKGYTKGRWERQRWEHSDTEGER